VSDLDCLFPNRFQRCTSYSFKKMLSLEALFWLGRPLMISFFFQSSSGEQVPFLVDKPRTFSPFIVRSLTTPLPFASPLWHRRPFNPECSHGRPFLPDSRSPEFFSKRRAWGCEKTLAFGLFFFFFFLFFFFLFFVWPLSFFFHSAGLLRDFNFLLHLLSLTCFFYC